MRRLVIVLMLTAAATASADPSGPGVTSSVSVGVNDDHKLDGSVAIGWRESPTLAVLGRVGGAKIDANDWAADAGVAFRVQVPHTADRVFVEPDVGGAFTRTTLLCDYHRGVAVACSGGNALGVALGFTLGVQLLRTAHVAVDLRAGADLYVVHETGDAAVDPWAHVALAHVGLGLSFE